MVHPKLVNRSRQAIQGQKMNVKRWGVEWYSKCRLDGVTCHLMWQSPCQPAIFRTRKEAREWIQKRYGYIKTRMDLRQEPHGWRLPRPVRVRVALQKILKANSYKEKVK